MDQLLERKMDEFSDKYEDYFNVKYSEGFLGTEDVVLYLENKPKENITPVEMDAIKDLEEIREIERDFHSLVRLNKEKGIEFHTRLRK